MKRKNNLKIYSSDEEDSGTKKKDTGSSSITRTRCPAVSHAAEDCPYSLKDDEEIPSEVDELIKKSITAEEEIKVQEPAP